MSPTFNTLGVNSIEDSGFITWEVTFDIDAGKGGREIEFKKDAKYKGNKLEDFRSEIASFILNTIPGKF